jgi:hypothetical protein
MNAKDAFHQTVHSAPGGCAALAVRLNMSPTILRNKANPNSTGNVVTIDDIGRVMELTGDYTVLHALAREHGFVCTKLDQPIASDVALLDTVTNIWAKLGELGRQVHEAVADGRIEPREAHSIETAAFTAVRPIMELLARVNGMAEK